ncbi:MULTISPECIES: NAD-dependent protein deacetylase [unclassified Janibacter]|uniref:NAD-dependent protein deacetylase n=1 Tax=unclassified Janibacter TaxID=2649294 RepID=UPI003D08A401
MSSAQFASATTTDPALSEIAALLRRGPALVLTGAGMSTDSGIPDYRGPDGQRRVTPMNYSEFVRSPQARQRYWARSYVGWQRFHAARPNGAHHAVTALQRAGLLGHVITQNVDGLHQAAGTTDVIDLHGSLSRVVCLACGDVTARRDLDARMRQDNPDYTVTSDEIRPDGDIALEQVDVERFRMPLCLACGGDALKPDVVFFGASVAKPVVERCFALTEAAPALLVLGSSLQVLSGLRFVRRAASRGIPVAAITRGPTRGDDLIDAKVDGDLGAHLAELVALLDA